ncbi:hypothetical protein CCH79_00006613 [Gambusia affinis]|uniref:Uncharacterized protein n=1 Tax=Gambusia affinis TaxID=33528 RepID=A0A315W7Q1_GAMAF|nr:hypothetical protein CCH79_00006613 [Gambusia affinis]
MEEHPKSDRNTKATERPKRLQNGTMVFSSSQQERILFLHVSICLRDLALGKLDLYLLYLGDQIIFLFRVIGSVKVIFLFFFLFYPFDF